MPLIWTTKFDTTFDREFGTHTLKLLPSGHYRFSVIVYEGADKLLTIQGFRVNPDLDCIIPPTSMTKSGGAFHNISLTAPGMEVILAQLREQVASLRAR